MSLFRALGLILVLLAGIPARAVTIGGCEGLAVTVSVNGVYEIAVPYPAWKFSGNIGFPLRNIVSQPGWDAIGGAYTEVSFDFFSDAPRHASIRSYFGSRAVLFTASLPFGGPNTFAFPSLTRYPRGLAHIAFSGQFAYPTFYGSNTESPWVFFDAGMNTVILSPVSHFMVASTGQAQSGELSSGISGSIATLPEGFSHQTLLVMDHGINRTFDTWGGLLTSFNGKTRPANDADVTLNRIGYWTDAGSTYYYVTEPGLTYPETLAAVKADFDRQGIALGYLQLDSWFYPKGASGDWRDRADGIYQYSAGPPLFAGGLGGFQRSLGVPLITHARWIDPQSPYRQQYRMSGNVSTDPMYWNAISRYLADAGVVGYEQDWLADRAQTDFNLTDPDAYLDNMARSMGRENIAVQYCTGTASHFLQSARYNNLTTIRASEDRFDRNRWTNFLYASRLAGAVGTWPFTDVLMSTETPNLILATLSAGPVGVGDRAGEMDTANLLRSVRPDGVIVKPDVPLTPIDLSFWNDGHNARLPLVASTYSDFGGAKAWYLFLYPQSDETHARFRLSDIGLTAPAFLYDYFDGAGRVVRPDEVLVEDVPGWRYQIAAPIGPSGMAMLGDTGHFVSLGKKRIAALTDDGTVHVSLLFTAGETIRSVRGYSPDRPSAAAISGELDSIDYDPATGLFTIFVKPGPEGTASLQISR
jgi:hypothetical protein